MLNFGEELAKKFFRVVLSDNVSIDVFSQKIGSITLSRMKVCNFALRFFEE